MCRALITLFNKDLLLAWPLPQDAELRTNAVFTDPEHGAKRLEDLHTRVVQRVRSVNHFALLCSRTRVQNIRTIAMYYERITTQRLAQFLDLTVEVRFAARNTRVSSYARAPTRASQKTELALSELVSSKQLSAKIDRPTGIVSFVRPETSASLLNDWAGDISNLLGLVESTTHLIQKEMMRKTVAKMDVEPTA
jgi:26S proteasome regulatory subunit N5